MRLLVLDPIAMADHLDRHLQRHDTFSQSRCSVLPPMTLLSAAALRDRLRTAAQTPGAGTAVLEDADLDLLTILSRI